jgi:hypothetical protein
MSVWSKSYAETLCVICFIFRDPYFMLPRRSSGLLGFIRFEDSLYSLHCPLQFTLAMQRHLQDA